jgi:hypothetical protein
MEIIRRFKHAEQLVNRMRTVGKHELYSMTQCPANFSVGYRTTPGQLIPDYVGNTCEPWIARFALILLDRLLDTGAHTPPRRPHLTYRVNTQAGAHPIRLICMYSHTVSMLWR